jgi:polyhydroxyalkanoate synthesis repressor PhaR
MRAAKRREIKKRRQGENFMAAATDGDGATAPGITVFRKYANRRLYDTSRSCCVTLADIARLVRKGDKVKVIEAKSGHDVTRQILAQILCDLENGQTGLLDESLLARLIAFTDTADKSRVGEVLNRALDRLEPALNNEAPPRMPIPRRPRSIGEIRAVTARIEALETRLRSLMESTGEAARRRPATPEKD